jgi:Fe-S-cluster containining protein
MRKEVPKNVCKMCGICCRLFLINLNQNEYYSGKYLTMFDDIETFKDFSRACEYGANLLKQQADGSCIYSRANKCSIHKKRPAVCKDFFCDGTENKYKKMRRIITAARSQEI